VRSHLHFHEKILGQDNAPTPRRLRPSPAQQGRTLITAATSSIRLMPISPGKLTAERRILYGLLTASFRPADQVVVLRSYLQQRQMLIRYAGQHTCKRPWSK